MELSIYEIKFRINLLQLIPLKIIDQSTRISIVNNLVALGKKLKDFDADVETGLEKLKTPEFKEKLNKYSWTINPKEEDKEKLDELSSDEDYNSFKKEYEEVQKDFMEMQHRMALSNKYNVNITPFSKSELENIGKIFPSGETTTVKNAEGSQEVSNDEILYLIIDLMS